MMRLDLFTHREPPLPVLSFTAVSLYCLSNWHQQFHYLLLNIGRQIHPKRVALRTSKQRKLIGSPLGRRNRHLHLLHLASIDAEIPVHSLRARDVEPRTSLRARKDCTFAKPDLDARTLQQAATSNIQSGTSKTRSEEH